MRASLQLLLPLVVDEGAFAGGNSRLSLLHVGAEIVRLLTGQAIGPALTA